MGGDKVPPIEEGTRKKRGGSLPGGRGSPFFPLLNPPIGGGFASYLEKEAFMRKEEGTWREGGGSSDLFRSSEPPSRSLAEGRVGKKSFFFLFQPTK